MAQRKKSHRTLGLHKARTGIEAIDRITLGGLPSGRETMVMGTAGSGKTVFALQVLVNGARLFNEAGILIAFEENSHNILHNAASFDWDIGGLTEKRGRSASQLTLIDGRLSPDSVQSGSFDLTGLLTLIEHRIKETGAKRIVFDGIDVLLGLLPDPQSQRREMYRIHELLSRHSLTGIVTASTVSPEIALAFMQSLADCIILLDHQMEQRTSVRTFRVVKYRGSGYVANEFPFAISSTGLEVANFDVGLERIVPTKRISSGILRLDEMLAGGHFRGSSVLVTGTPGTAKTTLGAAFVAAACARGERALYVALDEHPGEIVRNLASVNIHLAPYVRSGLLRIQGDRPQSTSSEEQFVRVRQWIREHQPSVLVIDPISAALQMGAATSALGVAQRFLEIVKSENITMYWTSVYEGGDNPLESRSLHVSTVADTWIHLTYIAGRGERNRTLTIIKSRGTPHSNQVRELILSREGITLADVSTVGGEVLLGTARWEQESAAAAAEQRTEEEQAEKRRLLEGSAAEAEEQVRVFQSRLERISADLRTLDLGTVENGKEKAQHDRDLSARRGGGQGPHPHKKPGKTPKRERGK